MTMTSRERVAALMARQEVDRVPLLAIHREFSVRQAGYKFGEVIAEPSKYVHAQVQAVRDFGFDAVFELGIPWIEEALGAEMEVLEDEVPAIGEGYLHSAEQIAELPALDLRRSGRAETILAVIRQLKAAVGDRVAVFGRVHHPFRAAAQLRGIQQILADILMEPRLVHELQEWYLPKLVELADVLIEAGADHLLLTNPLANRSCISRAHFEEFVHPYSKRFMAALRRRGYQSLYHICGDWSDRLDLLVEEPPDCLHIDAMSLADVKQKVGDRTSVAGNVRVVETLLQGDADAVRRETRDTLRNGAPGFGYAMSGNCVIPRDTPRENMKAMAEETFRLGRYPLADELLDGERPA